MEDLIYINGERVLKELPLRTLFFGEGVFETFRYKSRFPIHFDKHIYRLNEGARYLSMEMPEVSLITALLEEAVKESGISDSYVKLCLLSEGGSAFYEVSKGTQVLIQIKDYPKPRDSIKASVSTFRKSSSSPILKIKSFNYLENILARREALSKGYDEVIFINEKENITEGGVGNIFWYKNGSIYTPSVECGLLPGTTREILIESKDELGMKIEEGGFPLDELYDSEFAFFTNSLMGSVPLSKIDDISMPVENKEYKRIERVLLSQLGWI